MAACMTESKTVMGIKQEAQTFGARLSNGYHATLTMPEFQNKARQILLSAWRRRVTALPVGQSQGRTVIVSGGQDRIPPLTGVNCVWRVQNSSPKRIARFAGFSLRYAQHELNLRSTSRTRSR